MNTYYINDENFINSETYQNFIRNNPSEGYLKIRASAASSAIPISGLKIVVSKNIDNNNVIFFEGETNDSGVIEKITLPAPKANISNLVKPNNTTYDVSATYQRDNISSVFLVRMYENVYVVQNINILPNITKEMSGF